MAGGRPRNNYPGQGIHDKFTELITFEQTAHGFEPGTPIYQVNSTTYAEALADDSGKLAEAVVADVVDANTFKFVIDPEDIDVVWSRIMQTGDSIALIDAGTDLYLSQTEAGKLTKTKPETGEVQYIGVVNDLMVLRYQYTDEELDPTKRISPETADRAITVAETRSFFTNEGATDDVTLTLPTPAPGLQFEFGSVNANHFAAVVSSGTIINGEATLTSIEAIYQGEIVELMGISNSQWLLVDRLGTWEAQADIMMWEDDDTFLWEDGDEVIYG